MAEQPTVHAAESLKTLMTELAKALVDRADEVEVEVFEDGETTVLSLIVSPEDIGKLIGKQGRTARSLRTILGAASKKYNKRFALDIVEADDEDGEEGGEGDADDNRGNR